MRVKYLTFRCYRCNRVSKNTENGARRDMELQPECDTIIYHWTCPSCGYKQAGKAYMRHNDCGDSELCHPEDEGRHNKRVAARKRNYAC